MRSIRALHATVGRCNAFFDVTDGGLDALVPNLSIRSLLLERQRGRGSSSHRGGRQKGKGMGGDDDEGPCSPLSPCRSILPSFPSGGAEESATTSTSAEPVSSADSTEIEDTTMVQDSTSAGQSTSASSACDDAPTCTPASTDSTYVYRKQRSFYKGKQLTLPLFSTPTSPAASDITSDLSATLPTLTPTLSSPIAESSAPPSISPQAAAATGSNKTGAIIGGVLGGLVFILLLILGAITFLRRRRRKRTPASAEFRDRYIPRSTAPPPPLRYPLAAQTSRESLDPAADGDGADGFAEMRYHPSEPPPPFTKGSFNDPLFEKIYETQQKNVEYGLAS
ncbi:hypothetical protein ACEPAH_4943 [Sanghuangporus vaninii]